MEKPKIITSMMEENRVFPPSKETVKNAYIKSLEEYKKIYKKSIDDPEGFWGELAEQLHWYKKWDKVLVENFAEAKHEWFVG
ncbi:MAG: acetyl-coenzyme A synthetase N-terminal domain-containing protein, partial [Dehalococcoidales bacterium]|nr:acetyl-coenzyme A synthetase N-terminal domain-containing protein [Dehalococcoidales bacterium]